MKEYLEQLLEGRIDFEGQKTVERLSRAALIGITIISFVLGFALQSLQVTFGAFTLGTVLLCLFVVPPWPMYNRHPVQWLPSPVKQGEAKSK